MIYVQLCEGDFIENYEELYRRYERTELVKISDKAYKKSTRVMYIDYHNKKVLDIGADYGSTAEFFLKHGAKLVVAIEPDDENYKKLEKLAENKPILPIQTTIGHHEDIEYFIIEHKPDIVTIDCEGCEQHLIGVPRDVLTIPELYIIEHHNIYDQSLKNYMTANGFDIVGVLEWANTSDQALFEQTKLEIVVYERRLD